MASTTKKAKVVKSAKEKKQTESGRVIISLGATINIGDFEFARVDVGLQMPFAPTTAKERDEVFAETMEWTKTKLREEIAKVVEVAKSKS